MSISTTEQNALDRRVIEADARRGELMLNQVYAFLGRFVAYPSIHAWVAHALWILHAHLMDRWESTPRIAFLSAEPASGKSRALEVTEDLVPRALITVNVSPAYVFRKVGGEDGPPTVLFDEIDTVFGPRAKESDVADVAHLSGHGGADRHSNRHKCGHCRGRGETVEVAHGGFISHLHRECIDSWIAEYEERAGRLEGGALQ